MSDFLWYPVYTHPRAEKKAALLLAQQGIETYLPLQKTLKQWSDRKKWVMEPLFKSYIFIKIRPEQKTIVLQTSGISRFIYFSGQVATLPERQLLTLKQWLAEELPLELYDQKLALGKQVEIINGTLKGVKGELVELHGDKRLVLRFESMGASLLLQVPKGYVRVMG